MTTSKVRRIIAYVLAALALIAIVFGSIQLIMRNGKAGQDAIQTMRLHAVINAAGDVETFVEIAVKKAREDARVEFNTVINTPENKKLPKNDPNKITMAAHIEKRTAEAEAETRAMFNNDGSATLSIDTSALSAAIVNFADKQADYYATEKAAKEEFRAANEAEARAKAEAERQKKLDAGEEVTGELIVVVDMNKFTPTEEMIQKKAIADEAYMQIGDGLKAIYPMMDDETLLNLQGTLTNIIVQPDDTFAVQYDRYVDTGCDVALENPFAASMMRYSDDIIYTGLALLIVAALILFYETLSKKLGLPRIVLGVFFIMLCFLTLWFDLSLSALLSNTLVRLGMNSIMVLAMVPGIQCGISLNLGLPIGLVAGLVGGLCTIEWGIAGLGGFLVAIAIGVLIAGIAGFLYALMLNRLKGEEMSVTTYVGFSIVSLMCIAWLVLPFSSLKLRWPMGTGLRNTIGLDSTNFKHILDDFLSFQIGDLVIPTGALLFMALMCLLVWLFTRSKTGVAMAAVGNNPRFAEATGINVNKMRVIGTVLSTMLGAIGILVYSQSYGFMQLYTAPRQMGFVAASAILIGGATTSRGKISHVLIGTFLFQGVLTLGMPVANVLVPGSTFSETLRILISNGIILYALTKSGGGSRG